MPDTASIEELHGEIRQTEASRLVFVHGAAETELPPEDFVLPWDRVPAHDDLPIVLPVAVGVSDSQHVEVRCPEGVFIDYACLVVTRQGSNEEDPADVGDHAELEQAFITDSDPHWDVAHFYYSTRMGSLRTSVIYDAALVLVLRPMYHGQLRAGGNVSYLTVAMLAAMVWLVAWPTADGLPSLGHIDTGAADANSVVASLLLVPTVALAVIIRQNEHLATKLVLRAFRMRLGVVALATLGVAVFYAAGTRALLLIAVTVTAVVVAGVSAWMTWRSAGRSLAGTPRTGVAGLAVGAPARPDHPGENRDN